MASSSKCPPRFVGECNYEHWRKDIEIWCKLTDLPKKKQALAIHLSLEGRARLASSEITIAELESDDGVKSLLTKLDGLFLADAGRRKYTAFQDLYNLRRQDDQDIRTFVSIFEHTYFLFTTQGMSLPDPVMAFMLLASCKLSDNEQQLVMSAIANITYENMKIALNRIFSGDINAQTSAVGAIKNEPVFLAEELEGGVQEGEVFMVRGGGFQRRGRGSRGGRRGRWSAGARGYTHSSTGRRQNPLGPDGKVSRCLVCDSRFHWARDCPDAFENMGSQIKKDDVRTNDAEFKTAYLSLYTGEGKLKRLVEEAAGNAVLDTGCSTTVCGRAWLDSFLGNHELSEIVEESSTATFTFADGVTVPSLKRITLPCVIGGMRAGIATDVVECNIPLLLSGRSMKKAKMLINFDTDQATIQGRIIDLHTSESGHYLLPISQ